MCDEFSRVLGTGLHAHGSPPQGGAVSERTELRALESGELEAPRHPPVVQGKLVLRYEFVRILIAGW